MTAENLDYETLTLVMEKRIAAHLKTVRKKSSANEEKERAFFAAAANEALFVWMLLAGRLNSRLYQADKTRLIRMIEDVAPVCTHAANQQIHDGNGASV